jgi:hypothetical protein
MFSTIPRNDARARSTDGSVTELPRAAPPRFRTFAILASRLAGTERTPDSPARYAQSFQVESIALRFPRWEHDLVGKPVSIFPDHARFDIVARTVAPVQSGWSQKQTGRLGLSRPVQFSATAPDQRQICTVRIW